MRNRSSKKFFLIAIIFLITLGIFYFKYTFSVTRPIDKNDTANISFQVKKGQGIKEIASELEEKELIRSPLAFYFYVKNNNLDTQIIAGRFILKKSQNIKEIAETLTNPNASESVITIQEGLRIEDIETKLVELGFIQKGDFTAAVKNFDGWQYYEFLDQQKAKNLIQPLEGYLYPDTYFLDPEDFKPEDLIYLALDNFEKKWAELEKSDSKLVTYSIHEVITMASIIENEVFGKNDRHIVSGILWKRLENSWPIGADITLLYLSDDRKITASDLQSDSPYNTRKFQGLPPGPISNPSIESIRAALYPEASEYWFYLTTLDTGEVIYSKTNEEHNANREKYL